ncbi:ribonuclease T2 family protein [Photobacterium angustum]|uniref:Ribonuclease n=1 Tax=Photobacterium angustum TaxID=661 RepID=A0A2S7VYA4_PHOAN|nr:ribonuclease T2 [Photobacterium angustum]PQJ67087.1 ribonuclease [Photobacterium angustum]
MRKHQQTLTALCLGTLFSFSSFGSYASISTSGGFTASQNCEAFQSFRKQTNPDDTKLIVGKQYQIKALNERDYSWVHILVPDAKPAIRWVSKDCGTVNLSQNLTEPAKKHDNKYSNSRKSCSTVGDFDSYVLALTWQPGFCEHFSYKGTKPECNAINDGKLKITNLTLHGLWPNKASCGTTYGYCDRYARLDLSRNTINQIAPWMPNFYYQTKFGEYEWKKHGTCQTRNANDYFITATKLVEKVDASPIGLFIKDNIGRNVSVSSFKKKLVSSFGSNAVDRISLSCTQGKYLNEVRLNLGKDIDLSKPIVDLLNAGPKGRAFYGNCRKMIYIEDSGK